MYIYIYIYNNSCNLLIFVCNISFLSFSLPSLFVNSLNDISTRSTQSSEAKEGNGLSLEEDNGNLELLRSPSLEPSYRPIPPRLVRSARSAIPGSDPQVYAYVTVNGSPPLLARKKTNRRATGHDGSAATSFWNTPPK